MCHHGHSLKLGFLDGHCGTRDPVVPSATVSYDVRTEQAGPRALAAVHATTNRERLVPDMMRGLDMVWPLLRGQGVRTGHNVVVYYAGAGDALDIDAGVEVFTDFADEGEVRHVSTPSGEVATATHFGEYSDLDGAYDALERWCADQGRRVAGIRWEVYGDHEDDPALRRTDVYFLLAPPGVPGP
jgi:effector-binding domain-containing protein